MSRRPRKTTSAKTLIGILRAFAMAARRVFARTGAREPEDEQQAYRDAAAAIEARYAHGFSLSLQEINARAERLGVQFAAGNALDRRYKLAILDWLEDPASVPLIDMHMSWFRARDDLAAAALPSLHPVDAARARFLDRTATAQRPEHRRPNPPPESDPSL